MRGRECVWERESVGERVWERVCGRGRECVWERECVGEGESVCGRGRESVCGLGRESFGESVGE